MLFVQLALPPQCKHICVVSRISGALRFSAASWITIAMFGDARELLRHGLAAYRIEAVLAFMLLKLHRQ